MCRYLFAREPEVRILGYGREQMWEQIFTLVRELAVPIVFEHEGESDSRSTAIELIAPKINCGPDTLALRFRVL